MYSTVDSGLTYTYFSCSGFTDLKTPCKRNSLPGIQDIGHRVLQTLCLTTWKTLHTSQPLYLSELISHYLPPRSLRPSNTNLLTRSAGITSNFSSDLFCVCTFYLELFTCTHSFYRYPIHLLTPPTIPSFPVCLYRLVILCQRLRFVLTIFGAI